MARHCGAYPLMSEQRPRLAAVTAFPGNARVTEKSENEHKDRQAVIKSPRVEVHEFTRLI